MIPALQQAFVDWLVARIREVNLSIPVEVDSTVAPRAQGQTSRTEAGAVRQTPRQGHLMPRPGETLTVAPGVTKSYALGSDARTPIQPMRQFGGLAVPGGTYPPFLPQAWKEAIAITFAPLFLQSGTIDMPHPDAAPFFRDTEAWPDLVSPYDHIQVPGIPYVLLDGNEMSQPYFRDNAAGVGGKRRVETMNIKPGEAVEQFAGEITTTWESTRNRLDHFVDQARGYRYFALPFMAGIDNGRRYVRILDIPHFWLPERNSDTRGVFAIAGTAARNSYFPGMTYSIESCGYTLGSGGEYGPVNFMPEFWLDNDDGGNPPFPAGDNVPPDYTDTTGTSVISVAILRSYEDDGTTEDTGRTVTARQKTVTNPNPSLTPDFLVVEERPYDDSTYVNTDLANPRCVMYRIERQVDPDPGIDNVLIQEWAYNVFVPSPAHRERSRVQNTRVMHYLQADDGGVLTSRTDGQTWQNLIDEFLAQAVVYEGPFGILPAPRSNRTETCFGLTIDGSQFFDFTVVQGIFARYGIVAYEDGTAQIAQSPLDSYAPTITWQGNTKDLLHAEQVPRYEAEEWAPPLLNYQFLGDHWPYPVGEMLLPGGYWMVRERHPVRDRRYQQISNAPLILIPRFDQFEHRNATMLDQT